MSNEGVAKVIGIGDVFLKTQGDIKLLLRDVKHVLDICLNLISTSKLDNEGFCSTFFNGQCKLTKGSTVVARGKKSPTLYLLQAKHSTDTINAVENPSIVELWH